MRRAARVAATAQQELRPPAPTPRRHSETACGACPTRVGSHVPAASQKKTNPGGLALFPSVPNPSFPRPNVRARRAHDSDRDSNLGRRANLRRKCSLFAFVYRFVLWFPFLFRPTSDRLHEKFGSLFWIPFFGRNCQVAADSKRIGPLSPQKCAHIDVAPVTTPGAVHDSGSIVVAAWTVAPSGCCLMPTVILDKPHVDFSAVPKRKHPQ